MKKIIIALVAVVLVGAGFFGGIAYQGSKTTSGMQSGPGNLTAAQRAKFAANGGPGRVGRGGGMVEGTVVSIANDSMTIKLANGGSTVVYLGSSTTYAAVSTDAKSKLVAGASVSVTTTGGATSNGMNNAASTTSGSSSSSGSVLTAQSVVVK